MKKNLFICFCCFFVSLFGGAQCERSQRDYTVALETAISQIELGSIRNFDKDPFDWDFYRKNAFEKVRNVKNDEDFFALMQDLLADLEDFHSHYITPILKEYLKNNEETVRAQPTVVVDNQVGILTMPQHGIDPEHLTGEDKEMLYSMDWVKTFHQTLSRVSEQVSRGWIIDLTHNHGGSYVPMLGALRPFFVKSYIGGFYFRENNGILIKQKIFFEKGRLFFEDEGKISEDEIQYPVVPFFEKNDLPVVVLIGPETASSGELLALALSFQPNTILIGKPTAGVANVNGYCPMPDGMGSFMLSCGYLLDRDANPLYRMKIYPDIDVAGEKQEMISKAYTILDAFSARIF